MSRGWIHYQSIPLSGELHLIIVKDPAAHIALRRIIRRRVSVIRLCPSHLWLPHGSLRCFVSLLPSALSTTTTLADSPWPVSTTCQSSGPCKCLMRATLLRRSLPLRPFVRPTNQSYTSSYSPVSLISMISPLFLHHPLPLPTTPTTPHPMMASYSTSPLLPLANLLSQSPALQQPAVWLPRGLAVGVAATAPPSGSLYSVHGPASLEGAQRGRGAEEGVCLHR